MDYSSSDETDIKSFLEEAWKELQQQLKIQGGDLLGDERLCCMYRQMLDSHENGAYEAVFAMYPPFLERCANLAAANVDHTVTNKIIAGLMKSMPVEVFGWEGCRCFEVIEKHSYGSVFSDMDADQFIFPNRHVAAHGYGSIPIDEKKSFNTILLAHYFIGFSISLANYSLCPKTA